MTMTCASGHLPWTPWMSLVRASAYAGADTLLAEFSSLVPMLMTTRSAGGRASKSHGSGLSG